MDKSAFTILIIEDEPDISELIEYNLTQSGYSIIVSNNGEKGAKEAGRLRSEGKDYIVKDGDVLHFLFNN